MLLALSSYALLLSFPEFSVLLFVKWVASLVKLELNLRQDFQPLPGGNWFGAGQQAKYKHS